MDGEAGVGEVIGWIEVKSEGGCMFFPCVSPSLVVECNPRYVYRMGPVEEVVKFVSFHVQERAN